MTGNDAHDWLLGYEHVIGRCAISTVQELLDAVPQNDVHAVPRAAGRDSILGLAGLGKEIWRRVDAQQYVNELRDEWKAR